MFEAQFKRDGVFQKVIHHLKDFLSDINLQCDANEIILEAMDSAQVSLVAVSIDPRMLFDSYECEEPVTLVFDLPVLSRVLKHNQMNGNGSLRLLTCHSNRRVGSLCALCERSEGVVVYDIKLSDQPYQRFRVPAQTWACTVSMPTAELSGIIRYLNHFGDTRKCAICVTSDGVAFTTWNDFLTTTKLVQKSQDVTIHIDDPIQEMIFLLFHLKRFCPSENYARTVSFSLHPMAPIMLEYPLQETSSSNTGPELMHCGNAKFYLAPTVDDEDRPDRDQVPFSAGTQTNTVIEARIEGEKFSQILEVLSGSFRCAHFEFLGDELHIQTMNDSQISMADISLSSKGFKSFRCDHPLSCELNLRALKMALEKTGVDDILTLTAKNNPRTLRVVMESPLRNELTIHEIKLDNTKDLFSIPALPHRCTIMMPSTMFKRIILGMKGDNCGIGVTNVGTLFSADSGSHSILNKGHDHVFFDVKEPLKMTFSLHELKMFTKATDLGPTMRLLLTLSAPLMLEYTFRDDNGRIIYYLAPTVDEDDADSVLTQEEELELSAKIRSAKEVTPAARSRESKRNSTPERKSVMSTEKASNRKKASPRKTPKRCSECKQIKPCSEYFGRQLFKRNGKCIDCVVAACRVSMAEYNEPGTWRESEIIVERKRDEIRRLRSLGCERYECPIFFMDKNDNLSEDLHASFRRASPKIDELVGAYDIVYTYSHEISYKQRSARGRLILTSRFMLDVDGFGLHGVVEMSPLLSDCTEPHGGNFSFVQSVDKACHDFEVPIAVTEYPLDYERRCEGISTGTIRLLAERTATGWNPKENPKEDPWGDSWDNRIVSFDSADEADVLVKRREKTFLANSWLKNYVALPTELVLKIHEFVAFRPSPAFFFERDDLWIAVTWCMPNRTEVKTILVARRCK